MGLSAFCHTGRPMGPEVSLRDAAARSPVLACLYRFLAARRSVCHHLGTAVHLVSQTCEVALGIGHISAQPKTEIGWPKAFDMYPLCVPDHARDTVVFEGVLDSRDYTVLQRFSLRALNQQAVARGDLRFIAVFFGLFCNSCYKGGVVLGPAVGHLVQTVVGRLGKLVDE